MCAGATITLQTTPLTHADTQTHTHKYVYPYDTFFKCSPIDRSSVPVRVIPKMVLSGVVAIEKGAFGSPSTTVGQLYLLMNIFSFPCTHRYTQIISHLISDTYRRTTHSSTAEYPFSAIATRSTQARRGSTWNGPIYGLNRTNGILMLNWTVWLNWIA